MRDYNTTVLLYDTISTALPYRPNIHEQWKQQRIKPPIKRTTTTTMNYDHSIIIIEQNKKEQQQCAVYSRHLAYNIAWLITTTLASLTTIL